MANVQATISVTGTIYDEPLTNNGELHASISLLHSSSGAEEQDSFDECTTSPPAQNVRKVARSKPEGRVRRPSLYGDLFGVQPTKISQAPFSTICTRLSLMA
jgi:hypothetical protein